MFQLSVLYEVIFTLRYISRFAFAPIAVCAPSYTVAGTDAIPFITETLAHVVRGSLACSVHRSLLCTSNQIHFALVYLVAE